MSGKKKKSQKDDDAVKLLMCSRMDCKAISEKVRKALKKGIKERGLEDRVKLKKDNCIGVCAKQPAAIIRSDKKKYLHIKPSDVDKILDELSK